MPVDQFTDHTPESAPPAARRAMEATTRRLGYLPAPVGRLAESPELLDGFLRLSGLFEAATLDADGELIAALREQRALPNERLNTIREFTLAVMDDAGAVPDETLGAFLGQGFTRRNALEVVLGVGAYTLSTYANRMTRAPLDAPLAPFAWSA